MDNGNRNFDQGAARWDLNPGRANVTSEISRAILREIPLTPDMDVLDFGCGTGLITLALQPYVRSITGVDSSQGMLDVLRKKISDQGLTNATARYLNMDQGDVLTGSYHLVASSMTLHHVEDIVSLLKQFYGVLRPSGFLAMADLDSEGGLFHSDNSGVFHFGFDREEMREQCLKAGFQDIRFVQATQIEKPVAGGATHIFTVFLIISRQ